MLLESVIDMGVRFIPASHYVYKHDCRTVICKVNNIPDIDLNKEFAKSIDRILIKYDVEEIANILERIIKGKGKVNENNKDICSELVERTFRSVYKFQFDKRGFISPENI